MPSAAWITAAKKTPMEPVFYAECESVDAVNVTQNLASDWSAGVMNNVEIFPREGNIGGAGVRPQLLTFNNLQVNWRMWGRPPLIYPAESPWFIPPAAGFVESIAAEWRIMFPWMPTTLDTRSLLGWPATLSDPQRYHCGVITVSPQKMPLLRLGLFPAHALAPMDGQGVIPDKIYGTVAYNDVVSNVYPVNNANFLLNFRAQVGTITTKPFDMGVIPNIPSRVLFDHLVTGSASIVYTAQGSANGTSGWADLGTVIDGGEIAPYRYYRITAVMTSTGYDTPEIYSIRLVGGNSQYVYLGDHKNEPVVLGNEVTPYLQSVTSVSSKISLKDKPTVGDLTMTIAWMPQTSDLVQSTGKRRSVTVYIGFVGLDKADYEPYFTGVWDGYTADPDKRTFTVKLRDVWKKFKQKVPEQLNKDGATVPIHFQFGQATDGTGAGNTLNIMDAIVQVADLAKAPDRFIDKTGFASLKASNFTGTDWNVYRVLTEQKDSDEMLKELSVTAGVFLVPAANGKLTPVHYETAIAQTPTVTLDSAQIQFSGMTPDMADTVTRHNIYFNLRSDDQGRKLGGGNPSDYANVYTTIGSTASVIAERDREEVVVGEWFDNWGLSASAANGTPNPLTKLADRLASWLTPVATVGGKDVATTKTTVTATNVPLRYFADVTPGKMVYVNNLRLPCPLSSWDGFSNNVKFMVMSWAVDPKNFTLKLDLFQVSPLTYNATPTWYAYNQWGLYPQASGLTLAEQRTVGADGNMSVTLSLSFIPPTDYRAGYYEVWVSDSGSDWALYTTIPASAGMEVATATIPVRTGADYQVAVVTVNARGVRQEIDSAPQVSSTVQGTAAVTTPANAGLVASFTGRDCLLSWDAAAIPSSLLGGYVVDVLSLADVVKRTTTVIGEHYRYTYGMNIDDFGTATPSFKVRVSTINTGGGASTPQTITVANSAPAMLTALTATGRLMATSISMSYPIPDDFECVEVWSATTNNRANIGSNPSGTTKTGVFEHTGLGTAVTRYYWARVRDIYGQVSTWYPAGDTAGVAGVSISDPTEAIKLLNADVTSTSAAAYLAGTKSLINILDTRTMLFELGVVGPGVAATYTDAINQSVSEMVKNKGMVESLNSLVSGLMTSAYVPANTYVTGEYVTGSDSKIYRALINVPISTPPPNGTYWALTSGIITLVNTVQQNLDTATGTWTQTASSLTKDMGTLNDPTTGRVKIAETKITQNADLLSLTGESITGPLAFIAGAVFEPGVFVESVADIVGLDITVSKTAIKLDSANANILLAAGRIDNLTGRITNAEIELDGANAAITLRANETNALTGRVSAAEIDIDGANSAIALTVSKAGLAAAVDILPSMIGLKLNNDLITAGIVLSWANAEHTKSNVTVESDTFQVANSAELIAGKPIFAVGTVTDPVSHISRRTVGINAADLVLDGSLSANMIATGALIVGTNVGEGTKLAGIAAGAQVNPANLTALDSAAATKLGGIADGATVGATTAQATAIANAQTAAQVTTIIGNTVTTGFVEAMHISATSITTGILSADRIDVENLSAGSVNGNRTVMGSINILGGKIAGTGFSSSFDSSTALYTITFSTAFAYIPTVVVMPTSGRATSGQRFTGSGSSVTLYMVKSDIATSCSFDFIAIGPK